MTNQPQTDPQSHPGLGIKGLTMKSRTHQAVKSMIYRLEDEISNDLIPDMKESQTEGMVSYTAGLMVDNMLIIDILKTHLKDME